MAAVENGSALPQSALIFLGTGCSSAVPNALCLIRPSDPPCTVCSQSLTKPPVENPNYSLLNFGVVAYELPMRIDLLGTEKKLRKCNTSLLIDYCKENGEHKYILIDVGKTFREQVLRWFTHYRIPHVDSWGPLEDDVKSLENFDKREIILTHEHADATLGLDDIRAVQPFSPTNDIDPTPVYLTQYSMDSIVQKFPYLVQKKLKEGQEIRRVSQLDWQIIENDCEKPFVTSGLEFVPLPVMHGEDYVCLGFLFGKKFRVAYISDVSRFLATTVSYISKDNGQQLDLLILDTLYKNGSHNVHLCLSQTLEALKMLCPKRALLIGMTHEFDHHKDNEFLVEWSRREGIPVQLAHDGLRIPVNL